MLAKYNPGYRALPIEHFLRFIDHATTLFIVFLKVKGKTATGAYG